LKTRIILLAAVSWCLAVSTSFASEPLHILVMAPTTAAKELPKYEALSGYLKSVNPLLGDIKVRVAEDYPDAARFFKAEGVEGMFSGSFVAAVFIAKGYALPVARALRADGASTYGASIVAKAGTPPFGGIADLKGKRVAACPLATAGEVYLRSLLGPGKKPEDVFTPVPVASHQAALEAVAGGAADYAVVKSTVFVPESYPGLALVGSDVPGNPDNTFIMPRESYEKLGALISKALLGLEADTSEKAKSVKDAFGCAGFLVTTGMDFAPTFSVIRKTGIDLKTFDFAF
jgi:ABC-type phosphate/phosphonate transport system substrate-binding protein